MLVLKSIHASKTGTYNEYRSATQLMWLNNPPGAEVQTQIKKKIKAPRHGPLCREFTGTGEFPAQMASNAENVSIWWRHYGK